MVDKKTLRDLTADADRWDAREMGASAEHAGELPAELQKEMDKAIDEGLGLQLISIRMNKAVVEELKVLAKQDGIGYQPLIRQILARYVAEQKKQKSGRTVAARASVARSTGTATKRPSKRK